MGKKTSKIIPPSKVQKTAGTWTPTFSANVVSDVRTAADAAFTLLIPLDIDEGQNYRAGAKVDSIDVFYKIATAAGDDFATVEIEKVTLAAHATAVSGAAVTSTCDANHDTAAKRRGLADHKMTVTPSADLVLDKDYAYWLVLTVDAAATTVFTLYGVQVNYDLANY